MTLDHAAFPHILDAVLATAEHDVLLAFRATSRALRDLIDARLFKHVALIYRQQCMDDGGPQGGALCTPGRRRLPLLPSSSEAAHVLRHIRVLDLLDPAEEEKGLWEAHCIAPPHLTSLRPDIVRQLGTSQPQLMFKFKPNVYVDWTWRSCLRSPLPQHSLSSSAFALSIPATFLSFTASISDTWPPLSLLPTVPRVVLHCPATPLHTALTALLPHLAHLPMSTRELVVVFDERWTSLRCWEVALEGVRRVPALLAAVVDAVHKRTSLDEGGDKAGFDLTFVGVEIVHPDPDLQVESGTTSSYREMEHALLYSPDTEMDSIVVDCSTACSGSASLAAEGNKRSATFDSVVKATLLRQAAPHSLTHQPGDTQSHHRNADPVAWGDHVHFVTLTDWNERRGHLAELEAWP